MNVAVSGSYDDLRAPEMRFLEEAARLGTLHVCLWSDALVRRITGAAPKFPQAERLYFLEAVRYVSQARLVDELPVQAAAANTAAYDLLAAPHNEDAALSAWRDAGLPWVVLGVEQPQGFPPAPPIDRERRPGRKKVLVTGCYDWLHTGHVRFFEEASSYGELYVVVGNDANVTHLKGPGHPLFPQELRRYMAASIRYVHQALITSGWGWMDAEPEIEALRPEIYLVNEDGDKPEKRLFCQQHGIDYVVLKRTPKAGLQRRSSTDLRGY